MLQAFLLEMLSFTFRRFRLFCTVFVTTAAANRTFGNTVGSSTCNLCFTSYANLTYVDFILRYCSNVLVYYVQLYQLRPFLVLSVKAIAGLFSCILYQVTVFRSSIFSVIHVTSSPAIRCTLQSTP